MSDLEPPGPMFALGSGLFMGANLGAFGSVGVATATINLAMALVVIGAVFEAIDLYTKHVHEHEH